MNEETHEFIPAGYHVLIKVDDVEETTEAGIIIATKTENKREQGGHDVGTLVALGNTSFMAYEGCEAPTPEERIFKWGGIKIGDKIQIERYEGKLLEGFENHRVVIDAKVLGKFVVLDEKEKSNA